VLGTLLLAAAIATAPSGVIQIRASHSVEDTVDRLEDVFTRQGLVVFARIDFTEDARKAGLSMHPEQLLLFGNPRHGTPMMVATATAGLDLPLKVLVWKDPAGATWIAYNSTDYIMHRHGIPPELSENIQGVPALIAEAAR